MCIVLFMCALIWEAAAQRNTRTARRPGGAEGGMTVGWQIQQKLRRRAKDKSLPQRREALEPVISRRAGTLPPRPQGWGAEGRKPERARFAFLCRGTLCRDHPDNTAGSAPAGRRAPGICTGSVSRKPHRHRWRDTARWFSHRA